MSFEPVSVLTTRENFEDVTKKGYVAVLFYGEGVGSAIATAIWARLGRSMVAPKFYACNYEGEAQIAKIYRDGKEISSVEVRDEDGILAEISRTYSPEWNNLPPIRS